MCRRYTGRADSSERPVSPGDVTPTVLVGELHRWALGLVRHDWLTPSAALPTDGIYLFFERGEIVDGSGSAMGRIVRVGTHRVDGRFQKRIRQHYGNTRSLGGNKNGSVFRKHVGGALLSRPGPGDPRLAEWIRQGGSSFREVEAAVSRTLRDGFSFCAIPVPTAGERLALESGLIALLAQYPLARPSTDWLGSYAVDPIIRTTGLWNTQHVNSETLAREQFLRLQNLAEALT